MAKTINNYQIISKIASGGMSEVYLAQDINTGKKVALKILDAKLSIDPEYLGRFKKEASICKQLDHENIVKIISYGTFNDSYYIAYEYIQGVTLDKYIKQNDLTVSQIESISVQILKALSYAHLKNIIHRDIKPSNIIIEDQTVKILDFGIAKQQLAATMTKTGLFMGSPHYVSPEQIEGHDIDNRSDIYSFGIVLYEMIQGTVPFSAETPWGIIRAHLDKKEPEITKDVPIYLKEVVSKCLSKRKQDRFRSADEIIAVILNKEEIGRQTVIIDRERINRDEPKREKKKLSLRKKLAIVLPIVFIVVWFLTGTIFFYVGNDQLNNNSYVYASLNYRIARIFLIPNAASNLNFSLEKEYILILNLLNEGKYKDAADATNLIKEKFPEYKKINEVAVELDKLYNEKKIQYEAYIEKKDYENAKKLLVEMDAVRLGDDSFVKDELVKLDSLIEFKNLITQANNNFTGKKYESMYKSLEEAQNIFPEHNDIKSFYQKIESMYANLKNTYNIDFKKGSFTNCKSILNEMISIKRGDDSFSQEQLLVIELYLESDNYIKEANALAAALKFDDAIKLIDEAVGKNPEYEKLKESSKEIKSKKSKNATYLAKINDIQNVLNSGDILSAYSQANELLKASGISKVISSKDLNRLKSIKNTAYDQGKHIVANSVSFNLYDSSDWQSKNINNVFGIKMYQIGFSGWAHAVDNKSGFTSFAVSIGNNWEIKLILTTGDRLINTKTGENSIVAERRENPGALVDVARNGQSYTISAENRNFVITINSMGVDDYWFSSLNITVNAQ
ncbi:MAG: serine/threonine protein kinase [Actinobacteria bacterium]|nr:serine/threonine protein kinase [Actinomycetota bacterium]